MIRIGLLGASKISRGAIIAPARDLDNIEVTAVAARQRDRATAFAGEFNIRTVAEDYAALVASDEVDLVYNGLPPSKHAEWSIAALCAGKHVLCEKPFARNAAEAQRMVEVAKATGCYLIEAFHYRFHPLFSRVIEIVRSGELGDIETMNGRFNVPIPYRRDELRYDRQLGGGALMDLGCYTVHWLRTIAAREPQVSSAEAVWHESGVDITMSAEMTFPSGTVATIQCSMSEVLPDGLDAELVINGRSGKLTVINPLAPHLGHKIIRDTNNGCYEEEVPGQTTYIHQLQHVEAVLAGNAEIVTGGTDAINTMRVIDEIYRRASVAQRWISSERMMREPVD